MKKHCYLSLISMVFLICCAAELMAQDSSQTAPGFPIGAFFSRDTRTNQQIYNTFDSTGMNTVVQYAHDSTKNFLSNYNVVAFNSDKSQDYINHYATGLYSKWEAEENQTTNTLLGVKHKFGKDTTWQGEQCWSTSGLSSPADSLLFGPHYTQEKLYKRWLYNSGSSYRDIYYTARYRMALDYDPELVDTSEEVCRITARVRHAVWVNNVYTGYVQNDTLGGTITIKISDFPSDGSFEEFTTKRYSYLPKYPEKFTESKLETPAAAETTYTDIDAENGIEFLVEWLRDDTLCTLYVDYVEVYDMDGWNDFIDRPEETADLIKNYAQSYSGWSNIINWYAHDEPNSIDAYIPMHVVDSLVRNAGGAPLITEIYPNYRVLVNGDSQLVRYYNTAKPQTLMIDFYPVSKDFYPIRPFDLEATRNQFQISHSLQPGGWYIAQGFSQRNKKLIDLMFTQIKPNFNKKLLLTP